MTAGEIADRFPLARSTLSGHFNILKNAGLIVAERNGTSIVYSLNVSVVEQTIAAVMDLFERRQAATEDQVMRLSWRFELPQLVVMAAMFAAAAWAWPQLPERISVHWDFKGDVDRWGGKFEGLVAMPLIVVGIYLLMLVLPLFDPGRLNYRNFAKTYNVIRITIVVFMAAIYAVLLFNAFGHAFNVTTAVFLMVGVLFIVLGNFLGKIRPNWFIGVRTPWTLSSKSSWDKTHRLASWLFILMGALFFPVALLQTTWSIVTMFVIDGLCLAWTIVYSYLVYRNDPHRTPPADTSPSGE